MLVLHEGGLVRRRCVRQAVYELPAWQEHFDKRRRGVLAVRPVGGAYATLKRKLHWDKSVPEHYLLRYSMA